VPTRTAACEVLFVTRNPIVVITPDLMFARCRGPGAALSSRAIWRAMVSAFSSTTVALRW
jgi:hypothetical protein